VDFICGSEAEIEKVRCIAASILSNEDTSLSPHTGIHALLEQYTKIFEVILISEQPTRQGRRRIEKTFRPRLRRRQNGGMEMLLMYQMMKEKKKKRRRRRKRRRR
jgi:hypothetical protein